MKTRLLFLVIAFSVISTKGFADNKDVQRLLQEDAYDRALVVLNKQLSNSPRNAEVLFLKGVTLAKMARFNDAELVFSGLIEKHPELPEPYNNLAVIYAERGNFQEAEKVLGKAISKHRNYTALHDNLNKLYSKIATKVYDNVLMLVSKSYESQIKLALIDELLSVPDAGVAEARLVSNEVKKSLALPLVETKKVEVKPESVAVRASLEIELAVTDWANAWSAQDIDKYLQAYSTALILPRKLNFSQWKDQRKDKLSKPKFIEVSLSNVKIVLNNDREAVVKFVQKYRADKYQDKVRKKLIMSKSNGMWLIVKERSY